MRVRSSRRRTGARRRRRRGRRRRDPARTHEHLRHRRDRDRLRGRAVPPYRTGRRVRERALARGVPEPHARPAGRVSDRYDAEAAPEWRRIGDGTRVAWHDHRAHAMGDGAFETSNWTVRMEAAGDAGPRARRARVGRARAVVAVGPRDVWASPRSSFSRHAARGASRLRSPWSSSSRPNCCTSSGAGRCSPTRSGPAERAADQRRRDRGRCVRGLPRGAPPARRRARHLRCSRASSCSSRAA